MKNNQVSIFNWLSSVSHCFKDMLVWDKKRCQPPIGNIFGKRCEFIFVFTENNEFVVNDFKVNKAKKYINIFGNWLSNIVQLSIRTDKLDSKVHKAGFPVELPRIFIDMYTNKSDIVLDPFMGCGSTAVACKELHRNFIGIEISKEYCDIANLRLNNTIQDLF